MKNYLLLLASYLLISCNQKKINPLIEVYNEKIISIIDIHSNLEVLADSLLLPEVPVWNKKSNELLFVDNLERSLL